MSQTDPTDTWDATAKEALVGAVNEWNSLAPELDSLALQWTISHEPGHQKPAGQITFSKFTIDVFIKKADEPYCAYFEFAMQIPETLIPPTAGRHMDCLSTVVCKFNCYPLVKPESQEFIVVGVMNLAQISEVSTGRELAAMVKNVAASATSFVECMAEREPWWKLW